MAVATLELPTVAVEAAMVVWAEQQGVVEVSGASGCPGLNMGEFAPPWRGGAPGPGAAAVAVGDRAALRGGEQPLARAEVERFARPAKDHRDEVGLGGEPTRSGGRDRSVDTLNPGGTDAGAEGLQRNGDDHGDGGSRDAAGVVFERLARDRDERVEAALGQTASLGGVIPEARTESLRSAAGGGARCGHPARC